MQEKEIKKETKKETVKGVATDYVKLNDLIEKHPEVVNTKLPRIKVTLTRGVSRKTKTELVNITAQLHPTMLSAIPIRDGNNYITSPLFYNIILSNNMPLTQTINGGTYDVRKWEKNVPARYIKGVNAAGREYHALQLIFAKDIFVTSFFDDNTLALLKKLEERKEVSIEWVESPEKFETLDSEDNLFI